MRAAFFGLRVEGVPGLHAQVQTLDIGDVRSGQQVFAAARWPPFFHDANGVVEYFHEA